MVQHSVTTLKPKNEWRFPRLKCNKKGAAGAKSSKTNVFREKHVSTSMVPRNILRGFDVRKKVRLNFQQPKDIKKNKCYVFNG